MSLLQNVPEPASNSQTNTIFVMAHGAGAPMDSDYMNQMAEAICSHGIQVVRFEFPYMAQRRETGNKRPPDRAPKLLTHFSEVLQQLGDDVDIVIGGKSMGGRMASLLAAGSKDAPANNHTTNIRGVICLGYPFHAPGKPDKVRTEHFIDLPCPTLILQGERDPFGKHEEVTNYTLPSQVQIQWLEDGDHDFKPRKKSGFEHSTQLAKAAYYCANFIQSLK
jgi:hypothetical protein